MNSLSRNARVAGFIYLVLVILAPFRLIYIPSTLFVPGDATATASNIAAHELLFRLGMVSEFLCGVVVILLVLALYRLLQEVDRTQAILMVILGGLIPGAIDFIVVLNDAAALILVRGADFLAVFDKPQREALAMLFLRLHHQQVMVAELLWGLWLFPLGSLVFRSGFLPRFLGVWLFINGLAYVIESLVGLLLPQYLEVISKAAMPALLGEVALMLWLVIVGAKARPAGAPVA